MARNKMYRLHQQAIKNKRCEDIVDFNTTRWFGDVKDLDDRTRARIHEDPTTGFYKCDCDWCTSGNGIRQEKLSTIDFKEWKRSWGDEYQENREWYWDDNYWTGWYCRYEDCEICSACETYLYSKRKEMEARETEWESIYDSVANDDPLTWE